MIKTFIFVEDGSVDLDELKMCFGEAIKDLAEGGGELKVEVEE